MFAKLFVAQGQIVGIAFVIGLFAWSCVAKENWEIVTIALAVAALILIALWPRRERIDYDGE